MNKQANKIMTETKSLTELDLDHFFELSLDMLCIASTDGYFKRLNPAFSQILGWTRTELLERPFWDFIHPDDQADTEAEIQKLAQGEQTIYFEHRFETRVGDYKWLAWTACPSPDGLLYAAARDVTAQKETREALTASENIQIKITENVPGMIYQFVLRPDGTSFFPFASAWVEETFGLSPDELQVSADPIIALIHPDDLPSFAATVAQSAETMRPWQWEGRFVKEDGQIVYAQGRSKPELLDNGNILWNGVLTDITDLKTAESTLVRRAAELEIITKVSQVIAGTGEADTLLPEVLNLTVSSFNLYHAQIYEMNDVNSALLLTVGAGEIGRQLVDKGHQIAVNNEQSLVAQAARERRGVFENDLQAAPNFLANPLLPESRSSLSIPMIVGDQVLGVWNVQSDEVNHFDDEAVNIHQALATQIAAVLQNVRSFTQAERALEELNTLTRQLTREGWDSYLSSTSETVGFAYDLHEVVESTGETAVADLTQAITIQGETIGHLTLDEPGVQSDGAQAVMRAVAERLSAHLDNLRLNEEAQRRASALINVAEVSATTSTTLEVDRLLQAVTDLTKERFGLYHAHIYLLDEKANTLLLAAGAGDVGREMTAEGWRILLAQPNSIVARAARSRQGVIVNDVFADPDHFPNPLLPETRSEMAVPLIVGDQVIGVLDVQSERPYAFSQEDVQIQTTLAAQVAVAVQNARQYEQTQTALAETQRQARRMALLAQISEKITVADSLDEIYEIAANEATQLFPSDRVTLSLLDETGEKAQVIALGGERGSVPVGIPQPIVGTLTEKAIRSRKAVVIHDPNPQRGINSSMIVPLINGPNVLGTINIGSKQLNLYDAQDENLTFQMASLLSAAIENQSLYAEQEATVKRLRELDELKSSFLANMSHELRTPLNSVIGFTDVMLEGLDGPLTDDMETDLKIIQNNGHHLLNLINEILDMAKIEAGRMELDLEQVNLHDMVHDIVAITTPLSREKGLSLSMVAKSDRDVTEIEGDNKRIKQVLLNLASNAIKFTAKGHVNMEIERLGDVVQIRVQDTGAGIPPEQVERIFEAFRQADNSATRKAGGTGLGLPISRRLVEMHGGRLWVESAVDVGSTFFVELPIEVKRPAVTQEFDLDLV